MEHWVQILAAFLLISAGCSEENACLKRAGDPVTFMADANLFNKIEVQNSISVELIQHKNTIVEVSTRENLKNFISLAVTDKTLVIKDNNRCNWARNYDQTSIKIYHPSLSKISHFGSGKIFSSDTLYYPSLFLFSKNHTGDFNLIINNSSIRISINDVSNVFLSGRTENLFTGVYSGDGKIEAKELLAGKITFFHRGTNDMYLYPLDMLKGEITGIGNVVYFNEPAAISVKDTGPGQLIKAQD